MCKACCELAYFPFCPLFEEQLKHRLMKYKNKLLSLKYSINIFFVYSISGKAHQGKLKFSAEMLGNDP
jgi:hypothetical protein